MNTDDPPARLVPNPVVSFVIGLAIILLASILNAAGLNLTKLDHVRTSLIPRSSRKKDWMRPLWLLGMLLYILSQLIGSTLALEYMRAEYVAPLGSTSLVFNFLFARFLVGTPVTNTDIYGTFIVILSVIGIVAFGSINSGLSSKTDVTHLTYLWQRGGWLSFFFCMAVALLLLLMFAERLDGILSSRSDDVEVLTTETSNDIRRGLPISNQRLPFSSDSDARVDLRMIKKRRWKQSCSCMCTVFVAVQNVWQSFTSWLIRWLEAWTAPQDDKQVAWTLGIAWACCGGGLAGMCLVFAKATVKLLSGSLSKLNPGNQFGHAAPVFTIMLLFATAVLQIICLNRGLCVYDSTLVVPVFYGVYTATGFLDSLIFNDEVDAYQGWTLFLIFTSIFVLIAGVVLLTHKKPEHGTTPTVRLPRIKGKNGKPQVKGPERGDERETLWAVGEDSDDEREDNVDVEDPDIDHHQHPMQVTYHQRGINATAARKDKGKESKPVDWTGKDQHEEVTRLIGAEETENDDDGASRSDESNVDRSVGEHTNVSEDRGGTNRPKR